MASVYTTIPVVFRTVADRPHQYGMSGDLRFPAQPMKMNTGLQESPIPANVYRLGIDGFKISPPDTGDVIIVDS